MNQPRHRELAKAVSEIIDCIPAKYVALSTWYRDVLECDRNVYQCFQRRMLTEQQFHSFRKSIFIEMEYKLVRIKDNDDEPGIAHWKSRVMAILRKNKMIVKRRKSLSSVESTNPTREPTDKPVGGE